ncbi:hypothetical protein [Thalassospira alkalitolerans]|uniref:Uncharacterized protein n=1 Tax=Thalassospira alkalitolerans TaxID=1293890 RepID=A0A1Y2LFN0_9PROT|nr:hypothetical protein [Thalassospira alkalitolerans]OSQ50090.1 hypothetical protein TALK_00910 [Thalassospira alkalitolerans]
MTLRIKCLLSVWGQKYIDEFLSLSAPTVLASGNLPALTQGADLEFLVLTTRESVKVFQESEVFSEIERTCPVRFIFIDDLVPGRMYGVTLTLAYARGIADSGILQTDTHFIFMNADFVYADNSFSTILTKIQQGHTCIVAPSLRVVSENVVEEINSHKKTGEMKLSFSPRQLVRISLRNLHPTVVGKFINFNTGFNCKTHNQLYWKIDRNSILARHYLIFMMMIKPEKEISGVNSYCDYGFIPELVPNAKVEILADSDQFFMMELQGFKQELDFVIPNKLNIKDIASELSNWTTKEHRDVSQYDIIFHSEDITEEATIVAREAKDIVQSIEHLMTSPINHCFHMYWVKGVINWKSNRGDSSLPSEVNADFDMKKYKYYNFMINIRKIFCREKKRGSFLRRDWIDYYNFKKWIRSCKKEKGSNNVAIIGTEDELLKRILDDQGVNWIDMSSLSLVESICNVGSLSGEGMHIFFVNCTSGDICALLSNLDRIEYRINIQDVSIFNKVNYDNDGYNELIRSVFGLATQLRDHSGQKIYFNGSIIRSIVNKKFDYIRLMFRLLPNTAKYIILPFAVVLISFLFMERIIVHMLLLMGLGGRARVGCTSALYTAIEPSNKNR